MLNATVDGWIPHPSMEHALLSILRAHHMFCLISVCQIKKYMLFSFFTFRIAYLSFFFFLPHSRITRGVFSFCEISHNIKEVYDCTSVFISFPCFLDPPRPCIFHPTSGFSSTRRVIGSTCDPNHSWNVPTHL